VALSRRQIAMHVRHDAAFTEPASSRTTGGTVSLAGAPPRAGHGRPQSVEVKKRCD
jgi:hypothetical protein